MLFVIFHVLEESMRAIVYSCSAKSVNLIRKTNYVYAFCTRSNLFTGTLTFTFTNSYSLTSFVPFRLCDALHVYATSFWYCARIVHTFLSFKCFFLSSSNIVSLIAFDLLTKRRAIHTRHLCNRITLLAIA